MLTDFKHQQFASSLWFGGKDANDSLHLSGRKWGFSNISGLMGDYAVDITPGTAGSLQQTRM